MSVLLWILVGLLLLTVALLFAVAVMPVRVELVVLKQDGWRFELALRPLGRFGPRVAAPRGRHKPEKTKHKKQTAKRHSFLRPDPARIGGAVVRLVKDILNLIRIEAIKMDMKFGTGDPADTGHIYGLLMPFVYAPAGSPRLDFAVEPDFQQSVLEGRAEFVFSLIPARLLSSAARFGWAAFGPRR